MKNNPEMNSEPPAGVTTEEGKLQDNLSIEKACKSIQNDLIQEEQHGLDKML